MTSKSHWAIRLRLLLLVKRSSKWNGWIRDITGWLELHV